MITLCLWAIAPGLILPDLLFIDLCAPQYLSEMSLETFFDTARALSSVVTDMASDENDELPSKL